MHLATRNNVTMRLPMAVSHQKVVYFIINRTSCLRLLKDWDSSLIELVETSFTGHWYDIIWKCSMYIQSFVKHARMTKTPLKSALEASTSDTIRKFLHNLKFKSSIIFQNRFELLEWVDSQIFVFLSRLADKLINISEINHTKRKLYTEDFYLVFEKCRANF